MLLLLFSLLRFTQTSNGSERKINYPLLTFLLGLEKNVEEDSDELMRRNQIYQSDIVVPGDMGKRAEENELFLQLKPNPYELEEPEYTNKNVQKFRKRGSIKLQHCMNVFVTHTNSRFRQIDCIPFDESRLQSNTEAKLQHCYMYGKCESGQTMKRDCNGNEEPVNIGCKCQHYHYNYPIEVDYL